MKVALLSLLLVSLSPVASLAQTNFDMNTAFTKIADRYLEDLLESSPVSATALGDHRFDHLLDHVDESARRKQVESSKSFLAELERLDFTKLSRENQVDFSLLRQRLQKVIWEIETLREWEWNPLLYSGLPGNSIYDLMSRNTTPLSERLSHAAARCREFPRFFQQARDSLVKEITPHIHAETAIDQNKGITKLIDALLVLELQKLPATRKTELEKAIHIARIAINSHQQWLENELLPNAKGNPRLSNKLYREKFSFDLYSSFSPEDLRAKAEQQMVELHNRMYEFSKTIYASRNPNYSPLENPTSGEKKELIRACLEFAYEDAPSPDEVVEAAYLSLELTTEFVRNMDLLTLPKDPLEIIEMPEFRRGVAVAYCDAPGPLEVGGKTFYAVSPPPENWTEEQVNSFLREYNRRSLHNLTVHEAMPGHYVQLLRSNAVSSRLRSVLSSGTFIEGWAVYTESMMVDEGFLPNDLLMRLIVLKWNLRGVTNALLDQLIHLEGIDQKTAMKLMMNDAFQEEREAAGKYRRSLLTSVQLSTYFAGYMEVTELREATEKSLGNTFDLKTFHDRIMSFGSPPPIFVRALLFNLPIAEPQ